jgi:hypothetical protein
LGCKVGRITIHENYRGVDYVLFVEEDTLTYDEAALAIIRQRADQHFIIDEAVVAFGGTECKTEPTIPE